MVQNPSTVSIPPHQLAKTFGLVLPVPDTNRCLQQIEIQQPTAGKQFWQSTSADPGITIILTGKVRLIDDTNSLLTTLEAGASFGENTLFPESSFMPYSARASIGTKVGYLPGQLLQELCRQHLDQDLRKDHRDSGRLQL